MAAVVLGLALVALTNAQLSSLRGIQNSQEGLQAQAIASLIADDIALVNRDLTATFDNFGCLDIFGSYNGIQGCAQPAGEGFTPELGCTRYFSDDNLPDPTLGSMGLGPETGLLLGRGSIADPGGGYRVDVHTTTHPDGSIPAGRARVIDVFVCYEDPYDPGRVREIRETRILYAENSST